MDNLNNYEKLRHAVGGFKESNWNEENKKRLSEEGWRKKSQLIALRILRALRSKKMSQSDLAAILSVSPQQVNKWVKGSENFTIETLDKIGTALDLQFIEDDYTDLAKPKTHGLAKENLIKTVWKETFNVALKKKLTINSPLTYDFTCQFESLSLAAEPSLAYSSKQIKPTIPDTFRFSLASVELGQCIISEPEELTDLELLTDITITYNALKDQNAIACTLDYHTKAREHHIILLQTTCVFAIDSEDWNKLTINNNYFLPIAFAQHIGVITNGTALGILRAKTELTVLSNYFMKLINFEKLVKEDIIFK